MSHSWKTYYKTVEAFSSVAGIWPRQSFTMRTVLQSITWTTFAAIFMCQGGIVINNMINNDGIIQPIIESVYTVTCVVKFMTLQLNMRKIAIIIDKIENHWNSLLDEHEISIFVSYEKLGAKMSFYGAVIVLVNCTIYTVMPIQGLFLDIISPLNVSRKKHFPYPVENFDPPTGSAANIYIEEHYYSILLCLVVVVYQVTAMIACADGCYFIWSQHSCAMFAVVGHRLEKAVHEVGSKRSYYLLSKAVQYHLEALEFADILRAVFRYPFMVAVMMGTFGIAMTGVQLVINQAYEGSLRYISYMVNLLGNTYFLCWQGQKLLDHSIDIFDIIYRSDWYTSSLKSQRLLQYVMMRSFKRPSLIQAGYFCNMNFETYAIIIKSSMSYFTLLRSFC